MKITTTTVTRFIGYIVTIAFTTGGQTTGRVKAVKDGEIYLAVAMGNLGRTIETRKIPLTVVAAMTSGTRWP